MQNRSIWLEIILKKKKEWKSFSRVRVFTTPRTSPWNSPGQNTGVGSLSLLQGIFPTQGSNPGLPDWRRSLYELSHQGSPRILEWVACPFSSGSSPPKESNQGLLHCRSILYQLSYQRKKNLARNAGDAGSNLGRGTQSSLSVQQLSPLNRMTEPMHSGLCTTVKKSRVMQGRCRMWQTGPDAAKSMFS